MKKQGKSLRKVDFIYKKQYNIYCYFKKQGEIERKNENDGENAIKKRSTI